MSHGYYQEAIVSLDDFKFSGDAGQDLMTFFNSEAQERELEDEWTAAILFSNAYRTVQTLLHLPAEIIFNIVRDHLMVIASMPVVEHDASMAKVAVKALDQFVAEWRKRGVLAA